ncbi:MAG: hypothetical protein SGILL_010537 [Bacillariaceae sp.]
MSRGLSRRDAFQRAAGSVSILTASVAIQPGAVSAATKDENGYVAAVRPTAYRVDSTQPPTLIPLSNVIKQTQMLKDLGKGLGTDKQVIIDDTINLNNMLNKAVFGSINAVETVAGNKKDESKVGPGYASFVCLGVPAATTSQDMELATSLLGSIVDGRKKESALGLAFCPLSVQSALDAYSKSGDEGPLKSAIKDAGVDDATAETYLPLVRFANQKKLPLLAMSPELSDIQAARKNGLQSVSSERRQEYVADPQGFISLTQDPRYKLYTDRSLLKDFSPSSKDEKATGFFAERILVHEAGATVAAKYAVERPESMVAIVAPTPDVRFLLGINGRIPRVCAAINSQKQVTNKVTENAVTTILLNPTAAETLSGSRYLRLEIGTGPETLDYQTKVADYLWFSSSPKVNTIPRLMNG